MGNPIRLTMDLVEEGGPCIKIRLDYRKGTTSERFEVDR